MIVLPFLFVESETSDFIIYIFSAQAYEERNYHIFYQLCSAAKASEGHKQNRFQHLYLGDQDEFQYLNQGKSSVIRGVDDVACFDETVAALTRLGFNARQQDDLFRILAAILHLGNVNIKNCDVHGSDDNADSEGSTVSVSKLDEYCRVSNLWVVVNIFCVRNFNKSESRASKMN